MNDDIVYVPFDEAIKDIKEKIKELEDKYLFIQDYNLITSILYKLHVEDISLTEADIRDDVRYIIARESNGLIKIKRDDGNKTRIIGDDDLSI